MVTEYQLCYQNLGKKLFNSGVIKPTKMRFCNECNDKRMCKKCNNQVFENKEFEAYLNELKRHPPNKFGYMVPYFKEQDDLFVIVVQF